MNKWKPLFQRGELETGEKKPQTTQNQIRQGWWKNWFTDRVCPRRKRVQDTMQIDYDSCSLQTLLSLHQSLSYRAGFDIWYCTGSYYLRDWKEQGNFNIHFIRLFHKAYMNSHCRVRLIWGIKPVFTLTPCKEMCSSQCLSFATSTQTPSYDEVWTVKAWRLRLNVFLKGFLSVRNSSVPRMHITGLQWVKISWLGEKKVKMKVLTGSYQFKRQLIREGVLDCGQKFAETALHIAQNKVRSFHLLLALQKLTSYLTGYSSAE